ncbi:MAG: phosphoribosylamine--glycine ligase [Oscillospiraceae bacterium]|nr:phosphoribosylamine--glycine ligase [Oscillospiraceae bacterium]
MKLMVIGSGGREHALIRKLRENPAVTRIYALPGNGGMAPDAECVPISAEDLDGAAAFALRERVDFAVVAPDGPLCLGMVDRLEESGIPSFGPRKNAAVIEGSKLFAKELMRKYGIPTAEYRSFDRHEEALEYLRGVSFPRVVKADGLALGKGVRVCQTREEAEQAVRAMMEERIFGDSGNTVVVEECLAGPEVSVLCFTDGETLKPMVSAMDHKRALDGDLGLNTGGMGVVAPNPFYTPEIAGECMRTIFLPTVRAMKAEGRTFKGCLYFGLMLTADGPKVIEYNCRFGDPEAQAVLKLLESDLLDIMVAVREGTLARTPVEFSREHACCVIAASGGYPEAYETGFPVAVQNTGGAFIDYAGVKRGGDALYTAGGRVLSVTATAPTLPEAAGAAYQAMDGVHFEGMRFRRDIGKRAMEERV